MDPQRIRWFIGESVATRKALKVELVGSREFIGKPMFVDFDPTFGHSLWLETGYLLPLKLISSVSLL
jgi:hypothetical protein